MAKIAIATDCDNIWLLTAWENTLHLLQSAGHEVTGIWVFESRLGGNKKLAIPFWYLTHWGFYIFVKLMVFTAIHLIIRIGFSKKSKSFIDLAKKYKIQYGESISPNTEEYIQWIKKNDVDILLTCTGHIIKQPLINAVKLGLINKHSSLLPSNRGLQPYFWAWLHGDKQGISYHIINEKIDFGPLLYQENIVPKIFLRSMIAFYFYVFVNFPTHMCIAIQNLINGEFLAYPESIKPSYSGLPTKDDVVKFRKKEGTIIFWADIKYAIKLLE